MTMEIPHYYKTLYRKNTLNFINTGDYFQKF